MRITETRLAQRLRSRYTAGHRPVALVIGGTVMLENYGVELGVLLLGLVSACALLLGRKASRHVDRFREEHHERFTGRQAR